MYSNFYINLFRRRRSICKERAASLSIQLKGFDTSGIKDEKDIKIKPQSQTLQNRKSSINSYEAKKNANNKTTTVGMDKMSDDIKQKSSPDTINVTNKNLYNLSGEQKDDNKREQHTQIPTECTENDSSNDVLEKDSETAKTNFAYVNTSFDNSKELELSLKDSENMKELNTCINMENMDSQKKEHVE